MDGSLDNTLSLLPVAGFDDHYMIFYRGKVRYRVGIHQGVHSNHIWVHCFTKIHTKFPTPLGTPPTPSCCSHAKPGPRHFSRSERQEDHSRGREKTPLKWGALLLDAATACRTQLVVWTRFFTQFVSRARSARTGLAPPNKGHFLPCFPFVELNISRFGCKD